MEILIGIMAVIILILVIRNSVLSNTNKRLKKTISLVSDPIFRSTIAPYEVTFLYARLYKVAERKAREYREALYTLFEETHTARHTFWTLDALTAKYQERSIFSQDWRKATADTPEISIDKIHQDEQEFRSALAAAKQSLQS